MIKSFKSRRLQRLFEEGITRGLPPDQIAKIENRLATIHAADRVEGINVAGYRLHALAGDLRNFYAVWITANWRIVFRFERGDAYDVDHTDYH